MMSLLTAFFLWNAEASWSWWVLWVVLAVYQLLKEWGGLGE